MVRRAFHSELQHFVSAGRGDARDRGVDWFVGGGRRVVLRSIESALVRKRCVGGGCSLRDRHRVADRDRATTVSDG